MEQEDMQHYVDLYDGLRDGSINRDEYTLENIKDICSLFSMKLSILAMPKDHKNEDQATLQDALNGVLLHVAHELSEEVLKEKPDASLEEWVTLLGRMSDVFEEHCKCYSDAAEGAALDFIATRQQLEAMAQDDTEAREEEFHHKFRQPR